MTTLNLVHTDREKDVEGGFQHRDKHVPILYRGIGWNDEICFDDEPHRERYLYIYIQIPSRRCYSCCLVLHIVVCVVSRVVSETSWFTLLFLLLFLSSSFYYLFIINFLLFPSSFSSVLHSVLFLSLRRANLLMCWCSSLSLLSSLSLSYFWVCSWFPLDSLPGFH